MPISYEDQKRKTIWLFKQIISTKATMLNESVLFLKTENKCTQHLESSVLKSYSNNI